MSTSTPIDVRNLSKRYSLALPTSLSRILFKLAGKEHHRLNRQIWALRDVSFSVPRGTCLGVVGENGAGKSTLLKILCGVTRPTTGTLQVEGRTARGFIPNYPGGKTCS
jgi:lipopolysaccharide transport system ATP-binding protein